MSFDPTFARDTMLFPGDSWGQANVLRWMFFEQYSHEPYIASVRFWRFLEARGADMRAKIEERTPASYAALGVMEQQLAKSPFFVGEEPSLADVALYAYTHVAHEGGFDMERYPAINAWLGRVAAMPGHVSIDA